MTWVLVLVSNLSHMGKAFETIAQARVIGKWTDDIVLIVPQDVYEKAQIREIAMKLGVEFLVLPEIRDEKLMTFWDNYKTNSNYDYVKERKFQYQKFYIMHTFFKRWTNVIYLDAGIKIHGNIYRLLNKCKEKNVLYAHSDCYPFYDWPLSNQFCLDLDENLTSLLKQTYDLSCNYFQSTIMVYDTAIIQEDTVARLFYLRELFPFSMRNDQGIFNLYFLKERNLWRQLPIADEEGLLYDYHNRNGLAKEKYLMLKSYH